MAVAPPDIRAEAAIQLVATTDWADVFTKAGQNVQALFNLWQEAPAPILQQIIANQLAYLQELPDFAGIAAQIQSNLAAALAAPLATDPTTLDTTHRTFYELLPAVLQLPGIPDLLHLNISPTGKQLLAFSTTALSGLLLGMAGPVLGPLLVLSSSLQTIANGLGGPAPDLASAMGTLANIPAAMTDAFFNGGQHVDITTLAKTFGPAIGVSFPDGVEVGIALGGLLSPGGSVFNALDFAYDNNLLDVLHIHVPLATGTPVGPIGSFMEFTRTIAKAIGWDGGATAAATRTAAAQSSLAPANEVPRSVLTNSATTTLSAPVGTADVGTANTGRYRSATADKETRDVTPSVGANRAAKRTPAASRPGKTATGGAKRPAKAAAAAS